MYAAITAKIHKEKPEGTYFIVLAPRQSLTDELKRYSRDGVMPGELRLDDGRTITAEQRKKAYATLKDISDWNGDIPEALKEHMKYGYVAATGEEYFSLSNCSVSTARSFINYLVDFAMEWDVPLTDAAINRTDDINAALYSALKHKKCIVCGKAGAHLHHVQPIGMGRNRKRVDDSKSLKMSLCGIHHAECHNIGQTDFDEKYHIYGIVFDISNRR